MRVDAEGKAWHLHTILSVDSADQIRPIPPCAWCEMLLSAVALGDDLYLEGCEQLLHESCWQEREEHLRYMVAPEEQPYEQRPQEP